MSEQNDIFFYPYNCIGSRFSLCKSFIRSPFSQSNQLVWS